MFKLQTTPSYLQDVKVLLPGEKKEQVFQIEFRRLDTAELVDLNKRIPQDEISDIDVAHELVTGWKAVKDEEGNELDFTADNFNRLLAIHPVPSCIVRAFFDSISGARLKN